jgi:hypothetical protein
MATTHSNVVLLARVDDPVRCVTLETRSTVQTVEHDAADTAAMIVETALEIAPAVKDWPRY